MPYDTATPYHLITFYAGQIVYFSMCGYYCINLHELQQCVSEMSGYSVISCLTHWFQWFKRPSNAE